MQGPADGIKPLAVVRPATAEQVARILEVARRHSVAVIPYGAGSGVVGGVVPRGRAISLDMCHMSEIGDPSETDLTVRAGAGTRAHDLERHLGARGYTTGHYPQSLPLATVGGLIATRSSGTFSSLYGDVGHRPGTRRGAGRRHGHS